MLFAGLQYGPLSLLFLFGVHDNRSTASNASLPFLLPPVHGLTSGLVLLTVFHSLHSGLGEERAIHH